MATAAGLLLAFGAAVALNWSLFTQHHAAHELDALSLRRPLASLKVLFVNLRWLAGYLVGWAGWALYILALHFAALSVVQAVSAGGIGVLALLVHRHGHAPLTAREAVAAAVSVVGLGGLGISLIGDVPRSTHANTTALALAVAAIVGAGALLVGLARQTRSVGFALGAASGLAYAAGDIATKGALSGSGLVFIPVLLACHLGGFVALQLAFQRGAAIATAGASTLFMNAVPIVAGIALFGERLPGGVRGAGRGVSFALVLGAAVLLARSVERDR